MVERMDENEMNVEMNVVNGNLRERTIIDLFSAFEGSYGPSFECKYYPCHFSGQDCTFCYCPFYPCLNYDMGGEIKLTSEGRFVWDCEDCWLIHEKKFVEDVILTLSRFPRQRLVEENWYFYSSILQELLYGEIVVELEFDGCYNLMEAMLSDKKCEELEDGLKKEVLAVKIDNFSISSVRRIKDLSEAENEVIIPLKEKNRYFGIKDGTYVVCEAKKL